MLDIMNLWEAAGLTVDFVVCYFINRFYRSKVKDADIISSIPSYNVGEELHGAVLSSADKSLPYVCVSGMTQCVGSPLKSSYTDSAGVIQHQLYIEHKSKRTQGFWTDVRRVIKDKVNTRPFQLVSEEGDWSMEVTDALTAQYLDESLELVHDHYQPATDGLLARGLDRLFGEVTKGYQETESMLKVGIRLLGIGKVLQVGKRGLMLVPPDDGRRYILTTVSREELVRSMRADARLLNIARWVFLIAGSAAAAYIIYRSVMRYRVRRETQRIMDEFRQQLNVENDNDSNDVCCVVCLTQRRNVVLLNCGHICLCADCATALPAPKHCPVCRSSVDRIIPTYIS